jgi:hypothetical protein
MSCTFMIISLKKLCVEVSYLNRIMTIYDKPIVNIY